MLLDCTLHRAEFTRRIGSVRTLVDSAHPNGERSPISRDARGLAVLLLYAAYENLLTSLSRSLIEVANQLRVGNRRLRPGLKVLAAYSHLQSLSDKPATRIWKTAFSVVNLVSDSRLCNVPPETFPNDGTNFRRSQVGTFCQVFGLGDPAPVLKGAWERLDTIVSERNKIAHGLLSADEVGRTYSLTETRSLVDLWETSWLDFIAWVERSASTRDFFRLPR